MLSVQNILLFRNDSAVAQLDSTHCAMMLRPSSFRSGIGSTLKLTLGAYASGRAGSGFTTLLGLPTLDGSYTRRLGSMQLALFSEGQGMVGGAVNSDECLAPWYGLYVETEAGFTCQLFATAQIPYAAPSLSAPVALGSLSEFTTYYPGDADDGTRNFRTNLGGSLIGVSYAAGNELQWDQIAVSDPIAFTREAYDALGSAGYRPAGAFNSPTGNKFGYFYVPKALQIYIPTSSYVAKSYTVAPWIYYSAQIWLQGLRRNSAGEWELTGATIVLPSGWLNAADTISDGDALLSANEMIQPGMLESMIIENPGWEAVRVIHGSLAPSGNAASTSRFRVTLRAWR